MSAPLILVLSLMQAPAGPVMDLQLATVRTEPQLAAGFEVVKSQPAGAVEDAGPVVVGVVPSVDPSRWARRSVVLGANGWVALEGDWHSYFMWEAQRAQLSELWDNVGYRSGHDAAIAKARAEGRPAPEYYGLRGEPAPSSSTSTASVSGSNFSGGMYVGSSGGSVGGGSGGGRATGGGSGGGGKPGRDLP